jgi:hypothetical protein
MLKGDIGALAKNVGVSKTTIYRIAAKLGVDLAPVRGRCDKTVDYISGTTLQDERDIWLEKMTQKILTYRKEKAERRRLNSEGEYLVENYRKRAG